MTQERTNAEVAEIIEHGITALVWLVGYASAAPATDSNQREAQADQSVSDFRSRFPTLIPRD